MKKGGQGREGGKAREKYQPKSHTEHGSSLRVSSGDRSYRVIDEGLPLGNIQPQALWLPKCTRGALVT